MPSHQRAVDSRTLGRWLAIGGVGTAERGYLAIQARPAISAIGRPELEPEPTAPSRSALTSLRLMDPVPVLGGQRRHLGGGMTRNATLRTFRPSVHFLSDHAESVDKPVMFSICSHEDTGPCAQSARIALDSRYLAKICETASMNLHPTDAATDLLRFALGKQFKTVLADPPWRFINRTGKVAPEHRRLSRYETMSVDEIGALPIPALSAQTAHLYLWVPNALLPDGLRVMKAWGFSYKSNIIWHKIRKDGGSDGRGVGFYFRNVTEILLFGTKGKDARTLAPARSQVNFISARKREHSRKPDEQYHIIETCSPGPYLELFSRGTRENWSGWGYQSLHYELTWDTYAYNSTTDPR